MIARWPAGRLAGFLSVRLSCWLDGLQASMKARWQDSHHARWHVCTVQKQPKQCLGEKSAEQMEEGLTDAVTNAVALAKRLAALKDPHTGWSR